VGQSCPGALPRRLPQHAPPACDVPGAALFDLCDVELEEIVQPGDEFLSTQPPQSADVPAQRGVARKVGDGSLSPSQHVPGLSHRDRVCGARSAARMGIYGLLQVSVLRKRVEEKGRGGGRLDGCLLMASLDSNREFVDPTMGPR
jgi:hypothetical protein